MGKMKATLPDYPTTEYVMGEPLFNQEVKMWSMTNALKEIERGDKALAEYLKEVELYAKSLLNTLNQI